MPERELLIDALQQVTDALEATAELLVGVEVRDGVPALYRLNQATANARESIGRLVGDDEARE
jgi:predicted GNAT family N-acyltransferase